MKLAEDKQVVEALKKILEDYDYLEYDEFMSESGRSGALWTGDTLWIKVTDYDGKRNKGWGVPERICQELGKATNRKFSASPGDCDFDFDVWDSILIKET